MYSPSPTIWYKLDLITGEVSELKVYSFNESKVYFVNDEDENPDKRKRLWAKIRGQYHQLFTKKEDLNWYRVHELKRMIEAHEREVLRLHEAVEKIEKDIFDSM